MSQESVTLRVDGNDLVISISATTFGKEDPVITGLTVTFNIQRDSDDFWWDDTAPSWVTSVSEPSPLIAATQRGTTGIYEYRLVGGFDGSDSIFFAHINATGIFEMDFHVVLVPWATALDSSSSTSSSILISASVDSKIESLSKIIKRIFSDQRDHKQLIEMLTKQVSDFRKSERRNIS